MDADAEFDARFDRSAGVGAQSPKGHQRFARRR
jgi:hypothetical protein